MKYSNITTNKYWYKCQIIWEKYNKIIPCFEKDYLEARKELQKVINNGKA